MRFVGLTLLTIALAASSGAAFGQTSIMLRAEPAPIVDATINDRAVRLEVDLRMPAGLALSRLAAERLRVRRELIGGINFVLEGGGTIRARTANPTIKVGESEARAWTGIFPSPVTSRADGVIGPGALPFDIVTIELGPERPGDRSIVFALNNPDVWMAEAVVGGEPILVMFDVASRSTILNRPAARRYDASGEIVSSGELVSTNYMLGLSTLMQPVQTELNIHGIPFATTLARTNAPLLGAEEGDDIVVQAHPDSSARAGVAIGREALDRARCSSISVDRRARTMTLRCA